MLNCLDKGKKIKENEKNIVRKIGDYWMVRFQGTEVHVKHTKGMLYIARLLSSPGTLFSALLLSGSAETMNSRQPLIDAQALKEYRTELQDTEKELAEAEKNNDMAAIKRLEQKKEEIEQHISSSTTPNGRSRSFPDSQEKAWRGLWPQPKKS